MGSNPAQACMLFLSLIFSTAQVMFITAKFAFIPDRREMAKSVMWELYRQSRESVLNYVYCKPLLGSQSISSVGCQTCGKTKRNTHKKEIKRNGFKFGVCESTYEFCEASGSEKKKKKKTKENHWGILSFQRQQPKNKQTNRQTGVSVITWESILARMKVLYRLRVLQVWNSQPIPFATIFFQSALRLRTSLFVYDCDRFVHTFSLDWPDLALYS